MVQSHLTYEQMTDFGCFYTPPRIVSLLINKIKLNIPNYKQFTFVDTSCGYGNFLLPLKGCERVGFDIDPKAIEIARDRIPDTKFFVENTLRNVSPEMISKNGERVIIIGNPPYNDTTSKVKKEIKKENPCDIDVDLQTRDLGISFLLSYNKMNADYVAVLHPLSYMIKRANYKLLEPFFSNYILIDHCIISSQDFLLTSKTTGFPIIIALYKRDVRGTTYQQILNTTFTTIDNRRFRLNYTSIANYISKYPSKFKKPSSSDLLFFTMRDINALKRSKTFIDELSDNAIIIDKNKLNYYCYVDVFKQYITHIPYYLGNIDVFIDEEKFKEIESIFLTKCLEKHPQLEKYFPNLVKNTDYQQIDNYFREILGENYVY